MNWKNLITELSMAGVTQQEIASYCGCAQSTISELLRGDIKNPSFPIGVGISEFHKTKLASRKSAKKAA